MSIKFILLFPLFISLGSDASAQRLKWFYEVGVNVSKSKYEYIGINPLTNEPKIKPGLSLNYGGGIEFKLWKFIHLKTGIKTVKFREYEKGIFPFLEIISPLMLNNVSLPYSIKIEQRNINIPVLFKFQLQKISLVFGVQALVPFQGKQRIDIESDHLLYPNLVATFPVSVMLPSFQQDIKGGLENFELSPLLGISFSIKPFVSLDLLINIYKDPNPLLYHPISRDLILRKNRQISLGISHFL